MSFVVGFADRSFPSLGTHGGGASITDSVTAPCGRGPRAQALLARGTLTVCGVAAGVSPCQEKRMRIGRFAHSSPQRERSSSAYLEPPAHPLVVALHFPQHYAAFADILGHHD